MGSGYAGPGWEWPKGRDFDCTASCCVTVGKKSIETITGDNLASRMRHNQHHVQRQQLCPLWGAHQSRTLMGSSPSSSRKKAPLSSVSNLPTWSLIAPGGALFFLAFLLQNAITSLLFPVHARVSIGGRVNLFQHSSIDISFWPLQHRSAEAQAGLPLSGSFPRYSRSDPATVADDLCSLYPTSLFRPVLCRVRVLIVPFGGCARLYPRVHFFLVKLP